jgi:7,8-dihydropterin-6-yl-methyl-4-(beta-D-ribofuranosyl)aminobenzene 5'-phosphate synthase
MTLAEVDRVAVTAVVDNYADALRRDEGVARRFGLRAARKIPDLRAEHGLAHHVEVTRGARATRVLFDFGLTPDSLNHNVRELGVDPAAVDALVLSHGHVDHFGGLLGFLHAHRRVMKRRLALYAGEDHFLPRWSRQGGDRVYLGRLDRQTVERYDVDVVVAEGPTPLDDGLLLSGEVHDQVPFETIPPHLRVERDGELVQDTFIGEQTLVANLRGKGLVVVTSCSHRGVIGICRHAVRVSGVSKVHAVVGGFHLSGLGEERAARVVEAFRALGVDHVVPQHCTGAEAVAAMMHALRDAVVVSAVGTTFVFDAQD